MKLQKLILQTIRKYNVILFIFTFVVITNFNAWYVMWLFPTVFWLTGKQIKIVLNLSYACTIANIMNFALLSEDEELGIPYFVLMVAITVLLSLDKKKVQIKGEGLNEKN